MSKTDRTLKAGLIFFTAILVACLLAILINALR